MTDIRIFPNAEAVARAAANWLVETAKAAITDTGRFSIALSGGSTPKLLYALLASPDYVDQIDWSKVHLFWGDERCVPPNHPDSSYRMANETLIEHIPIPSHNVYRVQAELNPETASSHYETTLRTFFADADLPRFDVMLLGMGDDGHTASLFPGTIALVETERWVVANYVDKLGVWRITLTPPAINHARHIAFLVTGANKATRLRDVLHGERQPIVLPSQLIRPKDGKLLWLVDETAAASLD